MNSRWFIQHIRKSLRDQKTEVDYGLFYSDANDEELLCLFANAAQDVVLDHLIKAEAFHSLEHIIKKSGVFNNSLIEPETTLSVALPDYVHVIGATVVTSHNEAEETAAIYMGADAISHWHLGHTFLGIIGDKFYVGDGFRNDYWRNPADPSMMFRLIYIARPKVIDNSNTTVLDSFSPEVYYSIADIAISMLMAKQMRNPTGAKRKMKGSIAATQQNEIPINAPTLRRGLQ